jgi:hypothetical protein
LTNDPDFTKVNEKTIIDLDEAEAEVEAEGGDQTTANLIPFNIEVEVK